MVRTLVLTAAAALVSSAAAREIYVARVPNGANVEGVKALGHLNTNGGGTNNQFGLDFASADHEWTTAFCQTDSDGDGQTNGQELGDPCCQWVESSNAVVLWTTGVSHPGDADKTSDSSLWANITCDSATTTTSSSSSSAGTTTTGSDTSSSSSTSTPTPTPTTDGAAAQTVSLAAVAAASAVAAALLC